jgi:hypothetical protein
VTEHGEIRTRENEIHRSRLPDWKLAENTEKDSSVRRRSGINKIIGERWKHMYSADKILCVSVYSRSRSACNFVRLGTLLQLSSYNRFLYLYSLIYAARLLPADILSVRDVIRWQLGYSIALCASPCGLIWLLYQSALSSCVLPEQWTPCPSVSLLCSAELFLCRRDFQSLRSSDNCMAMYRRGFYEVTECLSKTGISVETCLLLSQQCLLGTTLSL